MKSVCSFLSLIFIFPLACLPGQIKDFNPEKSLDSLINQVNISIKKRDLNTAKSVLQKMDSMTGIFWKENSSQHSLVLYHKAIYAYYKGNLSEAMGFFENTMELRRQLYGEKDEYYYKSLANSGNIYFVKGDFKTALKVYTKGLELNREIYQKEGIHLAKDLNNVAISYKELGYFEKAEGYLLEAIRLKQRYDSSDIISISQSYQNLALLYRAMGNVQKDEEYILKAVSCLEKFPELKSSPEYLVFLTSAGEFYTRVNDFKRAQYYLLKSRELLDQYPKIMESVYYESYLTLKIQSHLSLGEYLKVNEEQEKLHAFVKGNHGRRSMRFALALMSAGKNYFSIGNYTRSKESYNEALLLFDSIQGRNSVNSVICLTALSHNAWKLDQFTEMLKLTVEAKSRFDASKSVQDTLALSKLLYLMGEAYSNLQQFEMAEELFIKSLHFKKGVLGEESEEYVSGLEGMAKHLIRKGDFDGGLDYLAEASKQVRRILEKAKGYLTHDEMSSYVAKFGNIYHQLLTLCALKENVESWDIAFENALFYKGFIKDQLVAFNKELRTNLKFRNDYYLLRAIEGRLSRLYRRIPDVDDENLIAQLVKNKYQIEKGILFLAKSRMDSLTLSWRKLLPGLEDSAAIIHFVHFNYYKEKWTDSIQYGAFILKREVGYPTFVPLCNGESLDRFFAKHRKRRIEYVNHLYADANDPVNGVSENLYDLIWKNLESYLNNVSIIHYSLSGILHNININFLMSGDQKYLSDLYQLVLHSSSNYFDSSLSGISDDVRDRIVLFGGIDYDNMASQELEQLVSRVESRSVLESRGTLQWSQADAGFQSEKWNYLPSSSSEVLRVRDICDKKNISNTLYTGKNASEIVFKSLGSITASQSSPSVIHLSTHGYFLSDLDSKSVFYNYEKLLSLQFNPMLRSGLILAGANKAWMGSDTAFNQSEDGVLSSYEISLMDLSSTRLVILSACETGLGEVLGNEGVYGLQRAFKIAGVQSIIMSLWQVPDKQTSELMALFYVNWLEKNMSIRMALQMAQKTLRDKRLEPYYWAGFVLLE